jgi:hypothetical protein
LPKMTTLHVVLVADGLANFGGWLHPGKSGFILDSRADLFLIYQFFNNKHA